MIQLPAQLTSYRDKVDGSASLTFATRELSDEEIVTIRQYRLGEGWLLFRENKFNDSEVPTEDAEFEGKSASERLRAVIYLLWKQNGSEGDFEAYRRLQMERLISIYKSKLD